ncbi:MAG: GDSL-type esterase/lipase family protein [Planctomycetota bacterium]|nr:GDSL-type esterase/lipase family protein [Planctomycetota bacterium]
MNRLLTFAIAASISAMSTCPAQQDAKSPAITPQPRAEEWWVKRHAEKVAEMGKGGIDLLMVGDSITQNFESVGAEVWKEHFEPRKAINLGFGGDRTNHVLWRLDNLPKLKTAPKAAVVLIGTNNICWGSDTPRQAAVGVQAVARKLHATYPETKIMVLGVFPRRRDKDHAHRKEIDELNSYLPALLRDVDNATFKDIGSAFLDDKGRLSKEMMPDTTHPSARGHEIWAEAIAPELDKMLGAASLPGSGPLIKQFGPLVKHLGKNNKDKARVLSGPKRVKLKRGEAPGKVWEVALGEHRFKVSIEDVTALDIELALQRIEQVPPLYRRCFEIVSEEGKDGVAFYKDLGGAAAHGGQQYLNIISRAGAWVMIHEAGHIMEQRARNSEEDILERWKDAIAKDKVSISPYGDSVHHEDLAEFAKVYALCLDVSKAELAKLKRRSPARYALWERVLRLAKAR